MVMALGADMMFHRATAFLFCVLCSGSVFCVLCSDNLLEGEGEMSKARVKVCSDVDVARAQIGRN